MKRHTFDSLSFITGLAFTGIGLVFLLTPDLTDLVEVFRSAASWFWPMVLVVIGLAVIAPAVTRGRDEDDTEEAE